MNKLSTTLLATALVSALSFGAFASVANANGPQRGGPQAGKTGPIHFVCSERGANRIENGLSRMAERLDLTPLQTTAFEAFKDAAQTAQADFAQTCTDLRPAERGENRRDIDLVERLNNRHAVMSAQLEAMGDVLPEFEVFFDSLSDEQKASMRPDRSRGQHRHGPGSNNGAHSHGPQGGQYGGGPANS